MSTGLLARRNFFNKFNWTPYSIIRWGKKKWGFLTKNLKILALRRRFLFFYNIRRGKFWFQKRDLKRYSFRFSGGGKRKNFKTLSPPPTPLFWLRFFKKKPQKRKSLHQRVPWAQAPEKLKEFFNKTSFFFKKIKIKGK